MIQKRIYISNTDIVVFFLENMQIYTYSKEQYTCQMPFN